MRPRVAEHTRARGLDSLDVSLSLATDDETLTTYRRLVFDQYERRNWLDRKDHPDGIVTDTFDAYSTVIVIHTHDDILGGMRIVHDTGMGFPHEAEMGLAHIDALKHSNIEAYDLLKHTPRRRIAEVTKVAGKKVKRMLAFDIAKSVYWYAAKNHIDFYVMVADIELFILSNALGIPMTPIGIPVYCEGSWTIPAITVPAWYEREISEKSPDGWEYIASTDNLLGEWSQKARPRVVH